MIVICTKCQAKFRVADDKIGSRGAKVRCSRCQTVFLVHPDLGTLPAADVAAQQKAGALALEAPSGAVRAPKRDVPTLATPPRNVAVSPPSGPDPFAAPAASADPFAAPAPDPFAAAPGSAAPDPFAAPAPTDFGDPFAAAVAPSSTLPVTDLSDLLGAGRAAAPPPIPSAAPPPLPAEAPPAEAPPAPEPDPFGADPFGAEPFASPDPFAAAAGAELGAPAPVDYDGGLALEDRHTPPPVQVPPPAEASLEPALETGEHRAPGAPVDPFAGFSAAAPSAGEPFDPGAFDFGGDPREAAPPLAATDPAPPVPAAPRTAPPAPAPPAVAPSLAVVPQVPERIPGARTSRLRAIGVNAVALVALLVVALAIWAVWRTDGPLEASALRPSAILAALGRSGAVAGPWTPQEVRSGVYERERGAPLLFVRGRVVSRAPAPVPAVKVAVQVVRAGQVVARGEVLAGAVPTPEELWGAADDAALAAVAAAARRRAPAQVRPGDSVPFLVAIGDAPPDLEGASLRIDVAPEGGGAP